MPLSQPIDEEVFSGGPARKIEHDLHLLRARLELTISRRALIVVLVSWPPLAILVAITGFATGEPSLKSFFTDAGCYARYLIAAPLLIIAEGDTVPIFGRVVRHFLFGGFIPAEERILYSRAISSTRRLLDSKVAEIVVILLAYAVAIVAMISLRHAPTPSWYWNGPTSPLGLSPAGMWHAFVSLPLLLLLLLGCGWLWKIVLWWRFLWLMSRLNLSLVSTHPDQAGGLKFVSTSIRGYRIPTLAFSSIVAGAQMNQILHVGLAPLDVRNVAIGVTIFVLVMAAGPLVLFFTKLRQTKLKGIFKYGALGRDVALQFEKKWLDRPGTFDTATLETNDFSAMTDLNQVVSYAHNVRDFPFGWRELSYLAIGAVIPFIPAALMAVPLTELLHELAKLLV